MTWDSDADLDLEIWRPEALADGALDTSAVLSPCALLPGGEEAVGGREAYRFLPPHDSGVVLVAVHFWSPGSSKDTSARVNLRVSPRGGPVSEFAKDLDDDSSSLWFPVLIDLATKSVQPVDTMHRAEI